MEESKGLAETIREMLELAPLLSAPDFEPCQWHGGDKGPDGSITMPYPEYHPEVDRFFTLASHIWLHPYELLPEDEPGLDLQRFVFTEEYFGTASLDQVRRYFFLIRRRERFCDGYIAGEIKAGNLIAALNRLGAVTGGN